MRVAPALAALLLLTSGAAWAVTDEEHIRRIESSIAPSAVAPNLPPLSLAERMKQLGVPGVSIAFIHDGKIAWARGYGFTRKGGAPVTANTLFQAGSISKMVSTAGILRETEKGKIDLDADVRGYLKNWSIPENKLTKGTRISLRQLLSHTAGMSVHGFAGYAQDAALPTTIEILNGRTPSNSQPVVAQYAPGKRFSYSGGGYVIAQQALNDATGIPFAELMRRNLFVPLGMTQSSFTQQRTAAQMRQAATPYRGWGEPVRGGAHIYPEMAPAGLWTTASDLARFVIAIQNALANQPQPGLSSALARQLTKPVATPKMTSMVIGGIPNGYGLGVVTGAGDHPFFWHDGQDEGFTSTLVAFQNGDAVVVLNNGDTGGELGGDIVRTIAREYGWPNFQPVKAPSALADKNERHIGYYRAKDGRIFSVTRAGGALFERHLGDSPSRLLPTGENRFTGSNWPGLAGAVHYEFSPGAKNEAASLTMEQGGNRTLATRVSDNDAEVVWTASLLHRIDERKQGPGTEAALRDVIAQLRSGKLDYSRMEKGVAEYFRSNSAFHFQEARRLGDLRRLTFKSVGPGGNDIYEAEFAHGWALWRIGIGSNAKVRTAYYSAD